MAADGVVPDVHDGLTPGCRCALAALGPGREYRPAAQVVDGALRMSGRDGRRRAIYGELVRMARDWELRHPLVDAHGNLGSINGDGAASADYTKMRLAPIAAELPAFPNLLVNGSFAVATGPAACIPPHNLGEVARATIACIEDPEIDVDGLLRHLPGPDFPTGAIVDGGSLRDAYATGRGELTLRARTHVEPRPDGRAALVISELPFGVVSGGRGGVIAEIVGAANGRRVAGVAGIDDHSDERAGLRIVVELARDAAPATALGQLYAHTRLETVIRLGLVASVAGAERALSLRDAIGHWIEHRRGDVARRTELRSADRILGVVCDELLEIAERHADERRTEIV